MDIEQNKKIIRNAYLQILKREPDKIGFDHFLNLFQNDKLDEEELIKLMKSGVEYKDIESMKNFIEKYDLLFLKKSTKKKLQDLSNRGNNGDLNSNFFWYGKNFGFLNNITIKSHLKVGYHPKIWISGEKPSNEYWNDIESKATIIDISEYFNAEEFLAFGGNVRILPDLWQFHFLYACGGFFSDLDNFILKRFPDDEWVICSNEDQPSSLFLGFIKSPPNSKIFLDAIANLKIHWGSLEVFTESYRNFFGNTNSTHEGNLFYPYNWTKANKLFENIEIPSETYAIHFYLGALQNTLKEKYYDINEEWCLKNKNTLLGRLFAWLNNN